MYPQRLGAGRLVLRGSIGGLVGFASQLDADGGCVLPPALPLQGAIRVCSSPGPVPRVFHGTGPDGFPVSGYFLILMVRLLWLLDVLAQIEGNSW